jgi:hypothetical protein
VSAWASVDAVGESERGTVGEHACGSWLYGLDLICAGWLSGWVWTEMCHVVLL